MTQFVPIPLNDPLTGMRRSCRMQLRMQESEDRRTFEILAITAGKGNGWQFPSAVLQESLALWDGVETFIDHTAEFRLHSLRDLAGVCANPRWDAEAQGIRLTLTPTGPSADLLVETGREWLACPEPRPRLGFSADLFFTALPDKPEVTKILKVLSLDLVHMPARGGAFVQEEITLLDGSKPTQTFQEIWMELIEGEKKMTNPNPPEPQAVQPTLPGIEPFPATPEELSRALLDARLAQTGLPITLTSSIRARFAGRPFTPAELDAALQEARSLVAELQGPRAIAGTPPLSMVTAEERLQAAVDDLLGAPRDPEMANARVERLSGIRELYTMLTGDLDLTGGYHPRNVRLATTATMAGLVKNALNKMIVHQWKELGRAGYRWWEPVVTVEHFNSLQQISGVLVGEIGTLPSVPEGSDYSELPLDDSTETGAWAKYGGYLPLTLELIDRDDIFRLKQYPRKLTSAALRTLSGLIAGVFTAGGGVGPTLSDGKALFHADHGNLGSTALSGTSWEAASAAIYNQAMLAASGVTGPALASDAKYLLVPRALRLTAMRILYPSFEREANYFSENMQRGEMGDVITVPEFSDGNNWAAAADPRLAPAIIVGERFGLQPEVFIAGDETSPAMFNNDEVRLKVRHFLSVFVADYRPLYKANVA